MSNAVATIEPTRVQPKSVLIDMATRFGMEPAAFEQTIRATVIKNASREEFAAFLLVAKEYNLNPLTKEIYAFPAKGGGIVPVVSVDGWVNLINSHVASDGFEFDMEHNDGKLVSCTCRMFRKDRTRPVTITEYLSECIRGTDPWKMQHRMLRHKALIQAARYAFGFSGIYDEDEAERIIAAKEIRGKFTEVDDGGGPPVPGMALVEDAGGPPAAQAQTFPGDKPMSKQDDLDIPDYLRRAPDKPPINQQEREWLESLENAFSACEDAGTLFNENDRLMQPHENTVSATSWNEACEILERHIERLQAAE